MATSAERARTSATACDSAWAILSSTDLMRRATRSVSDSLGLGGQAGRFFLGRGDDAFGFALGGHALLLIFHQQGRGFFTQLLGFGQIVGDLLDLLVQHLGDNRMGMPKYSVIAMKMTSATVA